MSEIPTPVNGHAAASAPDLQAASAAPAAPTSSDAAPANATGGAPVEGGAPEGGKKSLDLDWVWREVRKRVFIKLPFSPGVADAMEAVVPIALEDNLFVIGFDGRSFPLSSQLLTPQVRNTIENILRQAAGRAISIEIIEGTSYDDWQVVRDRRRKAQEAVIAMAEHSVESHHFEDVLNQIVSEIRGRVTGSRDRALPQVRAGLVLDVVPSLADAEEMLFSDPTAHDARRAMARALDRVASFLEVQPVTLALEVERYRRDLRYNARRAADSHEREAAPNSQN
jgi:hypothetical protein